MAETNKKTHYPIATIGSLTQRGGWVTTATSTSAICGLHLARVGDVVTYEDGSEAIVMDGSGGYARHDRELFALVGSHLSNGDIIIESLQKSGAIVVSEDDGPKGLFDPNYTT